ncbi:hypothetical protein GCM10010451_46320 [Streptomyces virens]|uniref:Secreted protein n=1 Tax=Streptomyces virens TaxID=285572 RepID=A0ABP6PX87_9ACTN
MRKVGVAAAAVGAAAPAVAVPDGTRPPGRHTTAGTAHDCRDGTAAPAALGILRVTRAAPNPRAPGTRPGPGPALRDQVLFTSGTKWGFGRRPVRDERPRTGSEGAAVELRAPPCEWRRNPCERPGWWDRTP